MARKKKKKSSSAAKEMKNIPYKFNTAFESLVALKKNGFVEKPKILNSAEKKQELDDTERFLAEMSNVEPLSKGKNKIIRTPDPDLRPSHPVKDDELEVIAHLSDLVSGNAEMDITFSDEYIQGAVKGLGPKLMQRLRRGQFPIQDHIDLHGLTRREAEIKVREFLIQSQQLGFRCVLVVHGRGLNSENHIPVLKEYLPVWLSRGLAKKIVLAFSTARPYDGGTGAIYVLLRKWSGSSKTFTLKRTEH